jgi:LmbE family N-acetylglucosaminyl deacetylase
MAVRRAEDTAATAVLGVTPVHLTLREAPHRGYDSAPALFAGVRPDDLAWQDVLGALRSYDADLWLGPQGLGSHVDHLQVVRAVAALGRPTLWWRDAPYALEAPDARPSPDLPGGLVEVALPEDRLRRAEACACYATQLGLQFGGEQGMRAALQDWAEPLRADPAARAVLGRAGAAVGE